MELKRGGFTYFFKFGAKDSCKLSQMAFDPYVFRKRQYIHVDNWEFEVERNYWKKEYHEVPNYPEITYHDFSFTTSELRITTLLQQKHVDGTVIDEALLRVFNQSGIPVLNIYFKNITINKIIREGVNAKLPQVTILFDYERIKMEYLNTPTGKGPAAKTIAEWNLKANTGDFEDPVYETYVPKKNTITNLADIQHASVMAGVLGANEKDKQEKSTKPFAMEIINHPLPVKYKLTAGSETFEGETNGKILEDIPKDVSSAKLTVTYQSETSTYDIEIGDFEPDEKGIQERLANLGLYGQGIDGKLGQYSEIAMQIYNRDNASNTEKIASNLKVDIF